MAAQLPGKEGLNIGPTRLTPQAMLDLQSLHGVEFAQVYVRGPGRNGGGGSYWLYSGSESIVPIPVGPNIIFISHTHPMSNGQVLDYPSTDDMRIMRRFNEEFTVPGRKPQNTSQIVPAGGNPINYTKEGTKTKPARY